MTVWAKFSYCGGRWHFDGLTSYEEDVAEFEELCAGEGWACAVLALPDPGPDIRVRPPDIAPSLWRRAQEVQVRGELL
jgi:hypothetical protein